MPAAAPLLSLDDDARSLKLRIPSTARIVITVIDERHVARIDGDRRPPRQGLCRAAWSKYNERRAVDAIEGEFHGVVGRGTAGVEGETTIIAPSSGRYIGNDQFDIVDMVRAGGT